jgi:acyl carrier protein phosphodiesterase
MLPNMEQDDWLAAYADIEVIGLALNRMAARLRQANRFGGAVEELANDYAGFEADFLAFMPDVLQSVEPQRQSADVINAP